MAATGEPDTDTGERGKPAEQRRTPPWAVPIVGGTADALLIGIVAAVISAVGAGNPSFWYDEAATISGATRTLPELARLIEDSDAAHPFYYLMMHGWFDLVPRTEFWARVPSWVAVGVAAGGLVVLARLLSTRAIAVCAGIIFAILPRTTAAGIEARPYGLTCAAAVWLTVVLVIAVRRDRVSSWLLYAVLLALSALLNVYLVLMVVVHGFTLLVLRAARRQYGAWLIAVGATCALLVPYLLFLKGQSNQLSWIAPLSDDTIVDVLVNQYFEYSIPFAASVGVLITVTVLVPFFRRRCSSIPASGQLLLLCAGWSAIPTTVILAVSAVSQPLYVDRYLTFTSPAIALALAICAVGIGQRRTGIALIISILALVSIPNYVRQRGDYAKTGMDYSAVADLIARQASPGDCLLLDDTVDWEPGPIRPLVQARPDAYEDLVDVGAGRSATSMGTLWDENLAPFTVAYRIARCSTIWTVSQKDSTLAAHEAGFALPPGPRFATANAFWVPRELGFRLVERWQFNLSQVTKAIRQGRDSAVGS
ncbi:MAG: mannosyltransferase [Mycobacterium sp.]|nr:mannosyltransferase [Mycobacterium sp.]